MTEDTQRRRNRHARNIRGAAKKVSAEIFCAVFSAIGLEFQRQISPRLIHSSYLRAHIGYIIVTQSAYGVSRLPALQRRHLVVSVRPKIQAQKRIPENRPRNWLWNSCLEKCPPIKKIHRK